MRLFTCRACGHAVYFENHLCERCGHALGFLADRMEVVALDVVAEDVFAPVGEPDLRLRRCANAPAAGCNWLVPTEAAGGWCPACALNRTIPDLSVPQNVERWQVLERAKRRLVYSLLRLELPLVPKTADEERGLGFDFLVDPPGGPAVMTGHADGIVTVNVAEADPVEGVRRREHMDEPYRTVLGHLRHEIAHYFWDRRVRDTPAIDAFRATFGDEREDYGDALARHYADGAPADWQERHISAYAAAHPWEDWAETFAHYLHIADTLETAQAFGIRIDPEVAAAPAVDTERLGDPYRAPSARLLVDAWLPLTFAVNSLNRSMGLGDLYPFVLAEPVVAKLEIVRRVMAPTRRTT